MKNIKGQSPKKKAAPMEAARSLKQPNFNPVDAETQCRRVIEALRDGPKTTIDLYTGFDILHPPARIFQLRKRGHVIITRWIRVETDPNTFHRVGLYVLVSEPPRKT